MQKRNANMELLRIVAIYFIVMLHLLGKTMAKDEMLIGSMGYYAVWTLEGIFRMGNNIFILISGYFFLETRFKLSKFVNLYIQTLFYSILFLLIAMSLGIELKSDWKRAVLPIVNSEYWFISVYIILYCLMPYIKILIKAMNKKIHLSLILLMFCTLSVIPTLFQKDQWLNNGGAYGIAWFVFLYLLGAYLRLYYKRKDQKSWMTLVFCLTVMVAPIYKFVIESFENAHWFLKGYVNVLYRTDSVFILIASASFLLIFNEIEIKNNRISKCVTYLGTGCLGVYLIHNNRNISHFLWETLKINYWLVEKENVIVALIIGVLVFLLCNFIEHLRKYLFKICGIDRLVLNISNKIESIYHRWFLNENINGE